MNVEPPPPSWFHVGAIAPPHHNPPGLESHVASVLAKLLGPKSQAHKIGIFSPWAEPISHAVTAAADKNRWHSVGYGVDRMGGEAGWIRCWLQIAATSQALVVFGPMTESMELVLGLCKPIRCGARIVDGPPFG